ncbi:hypothetical protein [Streptomyces sp. HUAS TT7]|uniref:hypothetical protein n=1 Tax=Streptomyces sp. HUAS TT7 TaxID=3447507 RepID=UPI003F65CE96
MGFAGNALIAVLVVRVFGRDAIHVLRRAAAAGVRAGVNELGRTARDEGQE